MTTRLAAVVKSGHTLPSLQALRSTQLPSSMISPAVVGKGDEFARRNFAVRRMRESANLFGDLPTAEIAQFELR